MRIPSLVSMAVAAAACGTGADPDLARVNQPFQLAVGERAVAGGLSIRFTGVSADSRCPSDVVCIWEGDGAVLVEIAPLATDGRVDTLHTRLDPRAIDVGGYSLELVALDPYPETTDPIPAGRYVATFVLR
jgi:hypothetical protein